MAAVLLHLPNVVLDARDQRGMGFLHWAAKRHYHAVLALALGRTEHGNEEEGEGEKGAASASPPQPVAAVTVPAFPFPNVYKASPPNVLEASRRLLASKDKVSRASERARDGPVVVIHCDSDPDGTTNHPAPH